MPDIFKSNERFLCTNCTTVLDCSQPLYLRARMNRSAHPTRQVFRFALASSSLAIPFGQPVIIKIRENRGLWTVYNCPRRVGVLLEPYPLDTWSNALTTFRRCWIEILLPAARWCSIQLLHVLKIAKSSANWSASNQFTSKQVFMSIYNICFFINHKNYNFLACDWFKNVLFSTNSLAKLLSDGLLLDSL